MEKKITIAMPVYNVGLKVKPALLSALNQTYENLEILVIDDKGTDNSMEYVQEVINSHPRGHIVRIIDHVVNKGTGATKNSAIDNTKGEYLYFMDSDDIINLDCIAKLYTKAQKYDAELVAASHAKTDETFQDYDSVSYPNYFSRNKTLKDYTLNERGIYLRFTWNKLYKVSFLRDHNIRCIPYHLCEDLFFSFQVILNCKRFVTMSDITYHYIDNPNSLMGRGYNKRLLTQMNEVIGYNINYIKDQGIYLEDKFVQIDIVNYAITCIKNITNSQLIDEEERISLINDAYQHLKYLCEITNYACKERLYQAFGNLLERGDSQSLNEIYNYNYHIKKRSFANSFRFWLLVNYRKLVYRKK